MDQPGVAVAAAAVVAVEAVTGWRTTLSIQAGTTTSVQLPPATPTLLMVVESTMTLEVHLLLEVVPAVEAAVGAAAEVTVGTLETPASQSARRDTLHRYRRLTARKVQERTYTHLRLQTGTWV